jgi:ParB-like chromosome segregation protein Spo0J
MHAGAAPAASHLPTFPLASLDGEASGERVLLLPIASIRRNPQHPRKTFDERRLAEMAASIASAGRVCQPIVVKRDGSGFVLVFGERRWRAAELAGLTHIHALEREGASSSLVEALVENLHRHALTAFEEILAWTALSDELGVVEAARLLGVKHQQVSKRRRVGHSADFVLAFAAAGGTSDLEALYELAMLAETDPDTARELIAAGGKKSTLRENARRARKGEPGPAPEDEGEIHLGPAVSRPLSARESGRAIDATPLDAIVGADQPLHDQLPDPAPNAIDAFFAEADFPTPAGEQAVEGNGRAEPGTVGPRAVPSTLVVEGVKLEDGTYHLATGGGFVKLRLSLDLERELFELIREHLTS